MNYRGASCFNVPITALLLLLFVAGLNPARSAEPGLTIRPEADKVVIDYAGTLMGSSNAAGPFRRLLNPGKPYSSSIDGEARFWTLLDPSSSTIQAGRDYSMALRRDGTLWTWGRNINGQLGNGFIGDSVEDWRLFPEAIAPSSGWRSLSGAGQSGGAIADDGSLWMWGAGWAGQLGDPEDLGDHALVPTMVASDVPWRTVVSALYVTLAIKRDGSLWSWGWNESGALGHGTDLGVNRTPGQVQPGTRWKAVSIAGDISPHSVGIQEDGSLWCWGYNLSGWFGLPAGPPDYRTPQPVFPNAKWKSVSTGQAMTVGIQADGSLWLWGPTSYGSNALTPGVPIMVTTNKTWTSVSMGRDHFMALRQDGTLWAWGNNSYGKLGIGSSDSNGEIRQIVTGTVWTAVSAGSDHTLALSADGSLWAWGLNRYGQLGIGSLPPFSSNVPLQVTGGNVW